MFESETTNYSASIITGDTFPAPASPTEPFSSAILDDKFEETDGGHSLGSPTLEVSEDYPVEGGEDDDSSSDSSEDDAEQDDEEEEGEDSGSTNDDSAATSVVGSPSAGNSHVETNDSSSETPTQEETVPAADRPSQVSILGGKYLLIANPPTPPSTTSSGQPATLPKTSQKCVHVETREQFMCKTIPRNAAGLNLLAAYHRMNESTHCVNTIHEIVLSPKSFYLIFPVNYGNVHAYLLSKKRLREDESAHLFRQMVEAVQFCHSKGIVLRDLKLGKFVFTNQERTTIKLESLEDAVVLPESGEDGLSDKHGCPNYVSPEKAEILRNNSKYPGKATDIWGLGIMLYTMLVGRYPFNDPDHGKLFVKIRLGQFAIPECLSQNVKCVIRCLLRKEPANRLSCAEILSHPWITDQGKSQSSPRMNGPPFDLPFCPTSQDIWVWARGTRRGLETTDNLDDQVVPEWTPPTKTPKMDTGAALPADY